MPAMRLFTSLLAISLFIAGGALGESETKRYLYLSTPDGAQEEGRSPYNGILVFRYR